MVRRKICTSCHRPLDARLWEAFLHQHGECSDLPHYDPEAIQAWVLRAQVQAGAVGGTYDGGMEGEVYSLHKQFPGLTEPHGPAGPDLRQGGQWDA